MIKYWPECLLTVLLFGVGFRTVDLYWQQVSAKSQVDFLSDLQQVTSALQSEALLIHSFDEQHHDHVGSLQLKLGLILDKASLDSGLREDVRQFDDYIFSYVQLARTLKNYRQYIVGSHRDFSAGSSNMKRLGNEFLANTFIYDVSLNQVAKDNIQNLLGFNVISFGSGNTQWSMLSQKAIFLLDNREKKLALVNALEELAISETLNFYIAKASGELVRVGHVLMMYGAVLMTLFFSFFASANIRQSRQLKVATQQASEAVKVKSHFLANMSHEIRTPINGIMGLTDLCLATDLSDVQKNYLNKLQLSTKSLIRIVNDVLDFSKIESNKLSIESISFNLCELIDYVDTILEKSAKDKGIEYRIHFDSNVPSCLFGDPVRIEQILVNLLSNAIKFTESGYVSLNVFCAGTEHNEATVHFVVEDTGKGISVEQQKKLFQRFVQAESSTTRKHGGTGLGLAICDELVKLMNGSIEVESTLGEGAKFIVMLPLTVMKEADTKNKRKTESEPQPLAAAPKPLTGEVLLVEDNEINQLIAVEIIQDLGLNVDLAENGVEALSCIDNKQYDLIFMDIQMPEMDGIEATLKIREQFTDNELPIVALTANVMEEEIAHYLSIGMNAYVGKPFDKDYLQETATRFIQS